jgi:hypothetical protein
LSAPKEGKKMKMLIGAIGIVILLSIIPATQGLQVTQPFNELPDTYAERWALGYHSFPNGVYTQKVNDDEGFGDGWYTAEIFANMKLWLKETPTSYFEGWLAGYHAKAGSSVPPGHSPAWTHGFTEGNPQTESERHVPYTDGWLG